MRHEYRLAFLLACLIAVAGNEPQANAANPAAGEQVTFNCHIAPLVFEQCAVCHRAGEVAPFPLLTYADVKKRAELIRTVTSDRYMPP
ncbi:MAG: hypothetical protein HY000_22400, partial [Planctomycetes bacterium]|nr:hypothetical protein [Planctomycetota bacterium]